MIKKVFDISRHSLEKRDADLPILFESVDGKIWKSISFREHNEITNNISYGLLNEGVKTKDKIMVIAQNSVHWNLFDMGMTKAGVVNVPCYTNMQQSDYEFILKDCKAKIIVVGDEEIYHQVKNIKVEGLRFLSFTEIDGVQHYSYIIESGKKNPRKEEVEKIQNEIDEEDLFTLIYTSGTTGNPKGAMLTHKNIVSQITTVSKYLKIDSSDSTVSFLPLCHIFQRTVEYISLYLGMNIYYCRGLDFLVEDIQSVRPTFLTVVPRIIEKVFEKIMAKGRELTGIKKTLFFWAYGLAVQYEMEKEKNWWYMFRLGIARRLIFKKWQEALGGNVRYLCSGSAPLNPKLIRIFMAAGIDTIEGYGLTETSPVVSLNAAEYKNRKIGTTGVVIDGVEVKIAEDGEILVKGHCVMKGYYNRKKETQEVLTQDGWFHTGDIGEMVDGKFLKIIDRKKELIKTSGGKYITPQPMEVLIKQSKFVEFAAVIGDRRKFPSVLLTLNEENVISFFEKQNWEYMNLKAASQNPEFIALVEKDIEKVNKDFPQYHKIKKTLLIPDLWTPETGEVTPTLKLKRRIIEEKYKSEIESLYETII